MGATISSVRNIADRVTDLEQRLVQSDPNDISKIKKDYDKEKQLLESLKRQTWLIDDSILDQIVGLDDIRIMLKVACVLPNKQPDLFFSDRPNADPFELMDTTSVDVHKVEPLRKILLYGPSGTGKTLLAKATAKDSGAKLFVISMDDVGSKYIHETEQNICEVFKDASKEKLSLIFWDEIDTLGMKRTDDEAQWTRSQKNTLLQQIELLPRNVIFIGCTNYKSQMDKALLRRFDMQLYVRLPDVNCRKQLIKKYIHPDNLSENELTDLANQTDMYSGDDLRRVIENARRAALEEIMRATFFKQNPENNNKYEPCDQHESGSIPTSALNVPQNMLAGPKRIDKRYILGALAYVKPTNSVQDVIKEAPEYIKAKIRDTAERENKGVSDVSNFEISMAMAAEMLTQEPATISALAELTKNLLPQGIPEETTIKLFDNMFK